MTSPLIRIVVGLVTCFGLALAPFARAQEKGTIKIATQSPLSGGQAALGEGIKLGAQLAVEKLKGNLEKQGFKVVLVPYDDQAKPDVGVSNAKTHRRRHAESSASSATSTPVSRSRPRRSTRT